MAHPDLQLVSRIIRTGELNQVIEWGITEDDLRTTEGRGLFRHLLGYARTPGHKNAVPGEKSMQYVLPTFSLCDDASMTLEALCSEVRKHRIFIEAQEVMTQAVEALQVDPLRAVTEMSQKLIHLQGLGAKTSDQSFSMGFTDVRARYEAMRTGIGMSKLKWSWEPFNAATGGLQEDDYIIFYGRPKSMKSFVVTKQAADLYDQGHNVLAYTKEMPAWQFYRRIIACLGRLPYDEFRLGKLSDDHYRTFLNLEDEVKEQEVLSGGTHGITVISGRDAPEGVDSMSWVKSKVDKHKPDVVIIDGLYLMSSDRKVRTDEERVRTISRAARQMVLDTGTPLIATMQANRAAAKHQNAELDEIAYSDAIGQDATVAIRVINEKVSPTIALVVGGSREFRLHGARIWAVPCSNFSFKEIMTEKEIEKAKEGDAKPEESEKNPEAHIKPLTNGKGARAAKKEAAATEQRLVNEQIQTIQ